MKIKKIVAEMLIKNKSSSKNTKTTYSVRTATKVFKKHNSKKLEAVHWRPMIGLKSLT